jgi:hypothetical protein
MTDARLAPVEPWLVGVLVIVGLVLVAYELLAVYRDGDTLSALIWKASLRRPIIPFLAGLLAGHFFWRD